MKKLALSASVVLGIAFLGLAGCAGAPPYRTALAIEPAPAPGVSLLVTEQRGGEGALRAYEFWSCVEDRRTDGIVCKATCDQKSQANARTDLVCPTQLHRRR